MRNRITEVREKYFLEIANSVGRQNVNFLVITHILPDRPEWFRALKIIGKISSIMAIPYSCDEETVDSLLLEGFKVSLPTLKQLNDEQYLINQAKSAAEDANLIIIEIGGYFARVVKLLNNELSNKILGIIEDTEAGHRKYQQVKKLPYTVVSLARSSLKKTEDFLVGPSCVNTTDWIIRRHGYLIKTMRSLVLGYGKIGRGLSYALRNLCTTVSVYDINPIKRIEALTEGFLIPEKEIALKESDIIFGTTGIMSLSREEIKKMKNGAFLVSCSSKKNEFPIRIIEDNYAKINVDSSIDRFNSKGKYFFLLTGGSPVNLNSSEGAEIGPVLSLVQAEIFYAVLKVINSSLRREIIEVDEDMRNKIAELWLSKFVNNKLGTYLL